MLCDTQFAEIDERFARVKDVLASYKVELRQVLKEVGKGTFKEFDEKGKVHKSVLPHSPLSQKTSPIHAINTRPYLNSIPPNENEDLSSRKAV